jgi:hypothetical protein
MKTKILFAFALNTLFFAPSFAQITVTSSSLAPIGSLVLQANDTTPGPTIVPGTAGTNQVWNFSALHNQKMDTIGIDDAGWTTYAANYTTANVAFAINRTGFYYLQANSTGLYVEGGVGHVPDPANHVIQEHFAPHSPQIEWPADYGGSYIDNHIGTGRAAYNGFGSTIDSVKIKYTTTSTVNLDAWGSITTPLGTFQALRQWRHSTDIDSTWLRQVASSAWSLARTTKDTIDHYTWYTNSATVGYPILSMDYKASTNAASNVTWLFANPKPSGILEQTDESSFSLYPNPASDAITLWLSNPELCTMSVSDMTGRLVCANQLISNNLSTIDIRNLNKGMYFITVTLKNGERVSKKFCVIH